jgi:hypothetical protein
MKVKIKYIVEKQYPEWGWKMSTGIMQEVEITPFGGGWMAAGGGWKSWGDTARLAELGWLKARLTEDFNDGSGPLETPSKRKPQRHRP